MKMEFKTLLFDIRDNVAHITLNRPEAANSINEEMGKDLMHAVLRCDEDPEIRAVSDLRGGEDVFRWWRLKRLFCQGQSITVLC